MAESSLSLTLTELQTALADYLRTTYTLSSTLIDPIIKSGLRQFYFPVALGEKYAHQWSFLRPTTTLTTNAPYSTGTVTIVAGVATLASGTFPSWAADGELIIDGETYSVASRDSGTQVTLDNTSVAASAGTEYQLIAAVYTLPDAFGGLISPLTWQPGQTEWTTLVQTSEQSIRTRRQYVDIVEAPQRFAIRPKTFTAATGQRYELMFDPVPDAAYIFTYTYRVRPDTLGSAEYPYGGMEHSETILASCLSAAELRRNDAHGPFHAQFLERLQASISFDREVGAPATLGCDGDWEGMNISGDYRIGGGTILPDGLSLGN
jgi:hypothetical protein